MRPTPHLIPHPSLFTPHPRVIPDYVSEEEERELLGLLTWQEGEEGRMKHRQVQ